VRDGSRALLYDGHLPVIRTRLFATLSASLLVPFIGCHKGSPTATGLFVTIELGGATADQIQLGVTGATPDMTVVPPTLRPAQPGGALPSPQTVTIFLPDALAGSSVTCTAIGFAGGSPLDATASSTATLRLGVQVPVDLVLAPAAPDAGQPDGAPGDGGPGKANGAGCSTDDECTSLLCVGGICCDAACDGVCMSCRVAGKMGSCSPLAAGTKDSRCADQGAPSCGYDGTCDGNGSCRKFPGGVACAPAGCNGAMVEPARACDGQGTCAAATAIDCTPFMCGTAGGAPACRTDCTLDTDCVAPKACVNGSCGMRPKQPNGAGCGADGDCVSGTCASGVCCDGPCSGSCMTCNRTDMPGSCLPVEAGKPDPQGVCVDDGATTCKHDGLCDGSGRCELYPQGTMCKTPTCGGRGVMVNRCDGAGNCTPANVDCTPYKCDPTSSACFTSCTSNKECAAGVTCNTATSVCP
jgi:hypothetical protein